MAHVAATHLHDWRAARLRLLVRAKYYVEPSRAESLEVDILVEKSAVNQVEVHP